VMSSERHIIVDNQNQHVACNDDLPSPLSHFPAEYAGAMTRLARACLLTALALMAMIAAAQAQATKPADGETATALLENEQIRVKEMRFKPGARTPAGSYPNSFVYALTDGALVFAPPGRTPYELTFKAGEALWLPAQSTTTANETNQEIRVLVVEIKARAPSGKRGKARIGSRKAKRGGSAR
jgi:quercetin dioxygenase-like cupin family protein